MRVTVDAHRLFAEHRRREIEEDARVELVAERAALVAMASNAVSRGRQFNRRRGPIPGGRW